MLNKIAKKIKRILVGTPLNNEALEGEKLDVVWGLPILSSDAISSVAYAGQEMLVVLIPIMGLLAFKQLTLLTSAIVGLLIVLMFSYRQTIENYPNGGGAYIVAKDNLGIIAGVAAGAALSVDYILTVAVSVSSGVEQIVSAFPQLNNHNPYVPINVIISVGLILIIMIGNLRGIRESSKVFGIPAYAFILAILSLIVVGFYKVVIGDVPPPPPTISNVVAPTGSILFFLLIRAFSNGCTALTGIEAVSNSIPNFKEPATKHAKTVLVLLSIIILVLFGGTSILANYFRVDPAQSAIIIGMAEQIFGRGFWFIYITATTFIILVLAANTAYSGFPMLISVMAKERYAPKQLTMRGDRLSYDNGIVLLSIVSILLIIIFRAKVSSLIGLYAIGVFISFTLSQAGMLVKWFKVKGDHWIKKAIINGFGAFVTTIVVIIIAYTKFFEGAWIVVILIPILIFLMLKTKKHYVAVYKQLRIKPEEYGSINVEISHYVNHVIVPIESINKSSIRALKYAKTISDNIIAFNVAIDDIGEKEISERYAKLNCDIPLIIRRSPFRQVVEPLISFIESEESDYNKGDMINVILPQFVVKKWWHRFLHNNTRLYIEQELLKHKHIVVSVMPLQLKDDDVVLREDYGKK